MTREEAIKELKIIREDYWDEYEDPMPALDMAIKALELCEDAISRKQAIDAVADLFEMSEYPHPYPQGKPIRLRDIKEKLKQLPSIQPKPIECEDAISRQAAIDIVDFECGEWNGLAKTIVKAIEQLPPVQPKPKTEEWIPVKFRPLTDEEQKEYPDYCYMADCPMPDDGEEILVSTKYGGVEKDECGFDDGYYLDSGYDWQMDIAAWMPSPKPYKPQESE